MSNPPYSKQVNLLLTVLVDVMRSPDIALKGGTAINLFLLDMPRLSVDIDLTYLKILSRAQSIKEISTIIEEIFQRLTSYPNIIVEKKTSHEGTPKQLLIKSKEASIKIEINFVLRGSVFSPTLLHLCEKAKTLYAKEIEVQCLSFEDLYAGKFCAALDRQHPRDLFDVHYFFQKFKLTENLKNAFIAYLLSTNRPLHELLIPSLLNQKEVYSREFESMTEERISYSQLEQARVKLIDTLNKALTIQDKEFLLSFEQGAPNWSLFSLPHIQDMPAIKWKLYNINKMDPKKIKASTQALQEKLKLSKGF